MIELELIHTCTVRRRTESIASQELVFGADSTVASNVPCLIQPVGASTTVGPVGIGQRENFEAVFLPGQDVRENDLLDWTDPLDSVAKVLVVRDVDRFRDNMFGPKLDAHVVATCALREVPGT